MSFIVDGLDACFLEAQTHAARELNVEETNHPEPSLIKGSTVVGKASGARRLATCETADCQSALRKGQRRSVALQIDKVGCGDITNNVRG